MTAAMAMQGADIAPTANQIAACARARATYREVLAKWSALEKEARAVGNLRGRAWKQRKRELLDEATHTDRTEKHG